MRLSFIPLQCSEHFCVRFHAKIRKLRFQQRHSPLCSRNYEPIIHNGEVVGQRVKNKYANYHPVVWLTANAAAAANETGLYEAKTEARFVIPTEDLKHHILHWPEFTAKYHASPDAVRALKQANGGDWKNWYVCDCPISLGLVDKIEVRTEDGSYRPKYIIHREE